MDFWVFSNKYLHILNISDGTYVFGAQLCIKTSIFNERSDFCYSDHPEFTPGLLPCVGTGGKTDTSAFFKVKPWHLENEECRLAMSTDYEP